MENKIFKTVLFLFIVSQIFGFITSLENHNVYFDYQKKYITPSHIIVLPIAYLLYGFMFKDKFVKLFKVLKILLFFSVITFFFYNSYKEKSQEGFFISVLVTYYMYNIMFTSNFFRKIWSIIKKSLILAFLALIMIWSSNIGFEQTLNELGGWLLFIGCVVFFFYSAANTSQEELEEFKRSNEEFEREMTEIRDRLDKKEKSSQIDRNISDLKYKRKKIYSDIIGGDLSPSELRHAQKYYDKLSDKIDNLENQKNKLK